MRLSFQFQACFVAIFLVIVLTVNGDKSSPASCTKPYNKMMACNLICNMIQDSDANNAMKMLQTQFRKIGKSDCSDQQETFSTTARSTKSQVFILMFGSQKIPVYCHMGNFGCGDGGWTLALKIDGNKKTFHYDSKFWSDRNTYNLAGGKTGFDTQETKLPTYWNTPFSKICLGMKIGQHIKFIVINKQANSLHSLIADGKYRAITLGRNTWKKLIGSQASLQTNCNKEGFNVASGKSYAKVRIGFTGNNEKDCKTCDSRIGFGTGGAGADSNTCGNDAASGADKGDKHIKAMGYILVQ